MELRVLSLYPEQMNIYADRGNIIFLRRRCEWRGIGFSHSGVGPGEGFDPAAHDLLYIGGGQDRDQKAVAADMAATKKEAIAAAADDGSVLLAVCGGYQLLGHSYQMGEETLPGLGVADLETVREPGPRLIGNVAIEADLLRRLECSRVGVQGLRRQPPGPRRERAEQLGVGVEADHLVPAAGQMEDDAAGPAAELEDRAAAALGQLLPERQVGLVAAALNVVPDRGGGRAHRQNSFAKPRSASSLRSSSRAV